MILSYQILAQFINLGETRRDSWIKEFKKWFNQNKQTSTPAIEPKPRKKIEPETIVKIFNQLGLEAEILYDYCQISKQLIVAEVIRKNRHPQFPKLWICLAATGHETLTIVCGADNFNVGDKVILAPVGAQLSKDLIIKERKFGEYYSQGMFCSWTELQIDKPDEGIAILPEEAVVGESNPLKYVGYQDCLFKVETPWQEKEWKSPWVLAQYLAKMLRIPRDKPDWEDRKDWRNYQITRTGQVGIAIDTLIKEDTAIKLPMQIKNTFAKMQTPMTNHWLKDLVQYIEWEMGINLEEVGYQIKKTESDLQTNRWNLSIKINYHQPQKEKKKLPYLLVFYAYQRFIYWIKQLAPKLILIEKKNLYWINDQIWVNWKEIQNLLGNSITEYKLKKLLLNSDFEANSDEKGKNLLFKIPKYRLITSKNQIASELLRLLGCDAIQPKQLNSSEMQWDKSGDWLTVQKISDHLLHWGIKEEKYSPLVQAENAFNIKTKKERIRLLPKNKNLSLQNSLISALMINHQEKANRFTINKIFFQENNQPQEKMHLGIVLQQNWINNPIKKQKIDVDQMFLVQIIKNICQIVDISPKYLQKEQVVQDKNKVLIYQNIDELLSNQGYENIFYQNKWIGQIGIVQQEKKKDNYFYLEIDLTTLFDLRTNQKNKFKESNKNEEKDIYVDLSLHFINGFESKIYCPIGEEKAIECNHYQHLIQYINSLDKEIKAVELIDQYQNQNLTFRVWKKGEGAMTKSSKKDLFAKVITGINRLENVKIL